MISGVTRDTKKIGTHEMGIFIVCSLTTRSNWNLSYLQTCVGQCYMKINDLSRLV